MTEPLSPDLVEARQLAEDVLADEDFLPDEEDIDALARALLSALDALGKADRGTTAEPSPVVEALRLCKINADRIIANPATARNGLNEALAISNRCRSVLAALSSSDSGHEKGQEQGGGTAAPSPVVVEYRREIDLRAVLVRAASALADAADPGGAPRTYRKVEAELRELVAALDQEAQTS